MATPKKTTPVKKVQPKAPTGKGSTSRTTSSMKAAKPSPSRTTTSSQAEKTGQSEATESGSGKSRAMETEQLNTNRTVEIPLEYIEPLEKMSTARHHTFKEEVRRALQTHLMTGGFL